MIAVEGGSFGLQLGGQATDFILLVMNDRGANGILTGKVKLGADAAAAAGLKAAMPQRPRMSLCAPRSSVTRAPGDCSRVFHLRDRLFGLTTAQINRSTEKRSRRRISC